MKHLLLVLTLVLIVSCNQETRQEKTKRERLEKIEAYKKGLKIETIDTKTIIIEPKVEVENTTDIIIYKGDYTWTDYVMDGNVMVVNNIFSIKAKVQGGDIVYSLYKNDKYTGNYVTHDKFLNSGSTEKARVAIIETLLDANGRPSVGNTTAFNFDK